MRRPIPGRSLPIALTLFVLVAAPAAVPDRVTRPIVSGQTRVINGNTPRLAQPQFDRGAVDPAMPMNYMLVLLKPSTAQQADLDRLLVDQQNPSSPQFHQWLTPESFGDRFGLSPNDHAKVADWLRSEGFTIDELARGRNWVAFSGNAGQVSKSLHTSIHRFQVDGQTHFANTTDPSVPDALAGVVGGFIGLHDFRLQSMARRVQPDFNSGTSHYLVPEDYGTIYNIAPLYKAGLDGTNQTIAVVGESDILIADIRAFRTRYNLPANDPKLVLYSSTDPGFNGGAQLEANLDLEWAGAIAPKATLYYIYGPDAFAATIAAVNMNVASIVSISYGFCEVNASPTFYRAFAQQGNAQGITILSASGDSGAAGCDSQGSEPMATRGQMVDFPAVLPEVTAVGGTQFVEGGDTYWASSNTPNSGSALSYIPEAAWNESATAGLLSSGGGASLYYAQPAWQTGPGVPADNVRHVPDIALSSASHDAYVIVYQGGLSAVAGTSCAAPSMAGIVALLNQYQVANKYQPQPGLGNINPQLYRLAQSAPSVFHDVASGDNMVHCSQGSPDCLTGAFGYPSAPGYDMATGLGSIDANALVTQWNTQINGVNVTLSVSSARVTLNDTVQATATVTASTGSGLPTGTVAFSMNGVPLGTITLPAADGSQNAGVSFPVYQTGTGTFTLGAAYSGDAAFSGGGATTQIRITAGSGAAAIVPSGPSIVWPQPPDAQGLSWQTNLTLREAAGVPAMITGFTIDGKAQPLSQYFPSPDIPANSSVAATVVFRDVAPPVVRTFGFTGTDSAGNAWSRQLSVTYFPVPEYDFFSLTATPLIVAQNPAAAASCQWSVQLNVDDLGGFLRVITAFYVGGVDMTAQVPAIFGARRIDAWGSQQGTLCFGGITPPASDNIEIDLSNGLTQTVTVNFTGPAAAATKLSVAPATVNLASSGSASVKSAVSLTLVDKTQPWTASIYPANRTTAWLKASQLSGIGPAQITLTASGAGFEPGVYRATLVIQSPNAVPQYMDVPVFFILGGSSTTRITGIANPASYQTTGSPGMLLSVFGTQLANTTDSQSATPLPYSTDGVTATVNGLPAPVLYVSPGQINIQIPYAVGAGPAILGINNNGQVAGFTFQMAPSAPGIFVDAGGNLTPTATVQQGATTSLYLTGAGEINPALKTAYAPTTTASAAAYKPLLPLSVTVGGVQAFLQNVGLAANQFGTAKVDFIVPASVPAGVQPVVVTVGGIASPPAKLTVQAPVTPTAAP